MFKPGQLVVCVAEIKFKTRRPPGHAFPVKGKVYTIRDTFVATDGTPCCRLAELRNEEMFMRKRGGLFEPGFASRMFRPLAPKRIEVFTNLLTDVPKQVSA